MIEPPLIPGYEGELRPDRYYCLDCVFQSLTEHEMRQHHKVGHENDAPLARIDYALGERLMFMRRVREKWIAEQAELFAQEMHEGFTPEDFVAEAEIRSA